MRPWLRIPGLLLLACCGGVDTSTSTGFIRGYCDLVSHCCSLGVGLDACRQRITPPSMVESSYDQAAGADCIKQVQAALSAGTFCGTYLPGAQSCPDVYKGSLAGPGESCSRDGDCAPSTQGAVHCVVTTSNLHSMTCQVQTRGKEGDGPCFLTLDGDNFSLGPEPMGPIGYACDRKDNLFCGGSATCERIQDVGSNCDLYDSGYREPTPSNSCVATAYCDHATMQCAARASIGGDCSSAGCVDTAYCDPNTNQCAARKPDGSACSDIYNECSSDCFDKVCQRGYAVSYDCL
jgi:hypothetical protein